MREFELETAIGRAYPALLPDLAKEGYRVVSLQAVLFMRRIDIVLQKENDEVCLIELKVGAPPYPAVRDQILDYGRVWKTAFSLAKRPRLIVISNRIPATTQTELAKYGIESRVINNKEVLAALRKVGDLPPIGVNFTAEDVTEEIRRLLSDFSAVAVPDGLLFGPPWTHEKVFYALVKRGERHKSLWLKNTYVTLYAQEKNCAVLYRHGASYGQGPLHLRPDSTFWKSAVFEWIAPFIEFKVREKKPAGFDEYIVRDWDGLADALDLTPSPSS